MIFVYCALALIAVAAALTYARERRRSNPALEAARRWNYLQGEDPADRRCREVVDAYVRGEIATEDLDWCCLLALDPPEPIRRNGLTTAEAAAALQAAMTRPIAGAKKAAVVPITSSVPWSASLPTDTIPWSAYGPLPPDEAAKRFADSEWERIHSD